MPNDDEPRVLIVLLVLVAVLYLVTWLVAGPAFGADGISSDQRR